MTGENPPVVALPSSVTGFGDDVYAAVADHLRERGIIDPDHSLTQVSLKVEAGEPVRVLSWESERMVVPEE